MIPRAHHPAGDAAAEGSRVPGHGHFRHIMGHVPTGVAVVTALHDGLPAGLTVGSFTSVSLEPPLVSFTVDRAARSWPSIEAAGAFCVNLLAYDQVQLCRLFSSRETAKFRALSWRPAGSGSPVIDGVVAWIDCDTERALEAGDHHLVIGRVRQLDVARTVPPLLFYRGGYGRVEAGEPR
ncbi:MAG TPA: flavin reductase family protein [Candidatus Dormibacteraeota bacterium]|nr:flavin reductase family protein [Candidatus Dormibacteraeota bacterium]